MDLARSDDAAIRVARRTLGAFALVGTTAVVWFGFVDPAGAYTPTVKTSCVGGQSVLTVEVQDYNGRVINTVSVQDNQQVLDNRTFGTSYKNSFIRPGNVPHSYRVVVRAGDDRMGDKGFSFERTVPQAVCAQATTAPAQMQAQQWPNYGTPYMPFFPGASWPQPNAPAPTTTTTHVAPPPVVTTTTTTTTTEVTTTTTEAQEPPAEAPGQSDEAPGQNKPEETTPTTTESKFLPALVPPLVSLIEPPKAEAERTSSGSATTPSSKTPSAQGNGPEGASTTRSTPSFPVTTPQATSKNNVLVLADDTNLPNTGASIAIPLLFGLCMLTAGAVVVFSMRNPRKRGKHAA